MQKELFDADGVTSLSKALMWVDSMHIDAKHVVRHCVSSLIALLRVRRDITSHYFQLAQGYIGIARILACKRIV